MALLAGLLAASTVSTPARALTVTVSAPVAEPSAPMPSETFTISGSLGTTGARPATLQYLNSSGGWSTIRTVTTSDTGVYLFSTSTSSTTRTYRVIAPPTAVHVDDVVTEPLVVTTAAQAATLRIIRNSATTAAVTGMFTPARPGRLVTLQYYTGSSWRTIGSSVAQDSEGKVVMSLSLSGLSRWSYRQYRLYSSSYHGASSIKTKTTRFMPGPTTLGAHVMRITVKDNVYPSTKGPEYAATVSVDGGDPLEIEEFGVRGSSSANDPKKPYKIKFKKKSTSIYGWAPAKRINLLAMYIDWALLRDKVALDLGRSMENLAFTSRTQYTELFVNDLYVGVYLVTEASKIADNRVEIDEETGMIMEADGSSLDTPGEFTSSKGHHIKFEDPDELSSDPEDVTPAKRTAAKARVNALEKALYSTKDAGYLDRVRAHLDLDSTIDYYLVKEFTKDLDSDFWRSCTFYTNDIFDPASKFYFGPLWDFDRSAGADTRRSYLRATSGWYVRGISEGSPTHIYHKTQWFAQLGKSSDFMDLVRARWAVVKDRFAAAEQNAQDSGDLLDPNKAGFHASSASDRSRWTASRNYTKRTSTYNSEVDWVARWYRERYQWMDANM